MEISQCTNNCQVHINIFCARKNCPAISNAGSSSRFNRTVFHHLQSIEIGHIALHYRVMILPTVPGTSEGISNSFDMIALTLAGISLIGASSWMMACPQTNDFPPTLGTPTCSNFTQHKNLEIKLRLFEEVYQTRYLSLCFDSHMHIGWVIVRADTRRKPYCVDGIRFLENNFAGIRDEGVPCGSDEFSVHVLRGSSILNRQFEWAGFVV